MSIIVLVLDGNARQPRSAVHGGVCLIGNKQRAVKTPIQVMQREVGIPLLGTQVDVPLSMQARRAIALAVIHAQTVQVQVAHIAVGSEHVVVVADGAVGIHVKVTAPVGTRGIHVGIAAPQLAAGLDVAIVSAVVANTGQVDRGIGPSAAAVGKIKAMAAGINAAGETLDVIVRQEGLDREVVEGGIHVVILVADVVVTVTPHCAATSRDTQVAGHPSAAFLIDLATQLHGRQFHVVEAQHLVQDARVPQVHLGIKVGLHAVHISGIIDGALTLNAANAGHIGIQ